MRVSLFFKKPPSMFVSWGRFAAGLFLAVALSSPALASEFTPTGSMAAARGNPEATVLANGRVLFDANTSSGVSSLPAEIYNPSTGLFAPTGRQVWARRNATHTLLADGRVLIAGGYSDRYGRAIALAELYDPASGTFALTGSMASARTFASAVRLPSGKVLVSGGYDQQMAAVLGLELYNPSTGTFAPAGTLSQSHVGGSALLLNDGRVMIVGGGSTLVEFYNPTTGAITSLTNPYAVNYGDIAGAVRLNNGKVLIVGGYVQDTTSAVLFNPASNTFAPTGSLGISRSRSALSLLPNGNVLVAGGFTTDPVTFEIHDLATAEVYDVANGRFNPTANPMPSPRFNSVALLLNDGRVLVAGGGYLDGYYQKPLATALLCQTAPTYVVTPSASGQGSISPSTAQTVASGSRVTFTLTPAVGYMPVVSGTCGGTISGNTYTTNPVSQNCTVVATFTTAVYSVSPSAGANGTISPSAVQQVSAGGRATFTVTPANGYRAAVGGTCGGALSGTTYTTNPVNQNCTVQATFTLITYTVTPFAGSHGTISPSTVQNVPLNQRVTFTVTPSPGYTSTVAGTCGGSLVGTTYTTNPITANCTVNASFAPGQFIVTPSAGAHGTIYPSNAQTVSGGSSGHFTVTPASGYRASMSGTCGGTLSGTAYTTNPVTANCTVVALFVVASVKNPATLADASVAGAWQSDTAGDEAVVVSLPGDDGSLALSVGWFTFDAAGAPRWYVIDSAVAPGATFAEATVSERVAGNARIRRPVSTHGAGRAFLSRFDCATLQLDYTLASGPAGSVRFHRSGETQCEEASSTASFPQEGADGEGGKLWLSVDSSGQVQGGVLATFTPPGGKYGSLPVWYTWTDFPQAPDSALYQMGALGDKQEVGRVTASHDACGRPVFDYRFLAGPLAGRAGRMPTVPTGVPCSP